jgi:hypothetical protein
MIIEPETPVIPVTVEQVPRTLRMYSLGEHELDMLTGNYSSIWALGFGAAFSVLLISVVTVVTVKLSDRAFASFMAALIVSGVLSAIFLLATLVEYRRVSVRVSSIKTR